MAGKLLEDGHLYREYRRLCAAERLPAAVRNCALILGILQTRSLKNALLSISKEFEKIEVETLRDKFDEVVGDSPENHMHAQDGFQVGGGAAPGEASGATAPAQMGRQEALQQFTVDMTEQARSGEMDPIVGRDEQASP